MHYACIAPAAGHATSCDACVASLFSKGKTQTTLNPNQSKTDANDINLILFSCLL